MPSSGRHLPPRAVDAIKGAIAIGEAAVVEREGAEVQAGKATTWRTERID